MLASKPVNSLNQKNKALGHPKCQHNLSESLRFRHLFYMFKWKVIDEAVSGAADRV
jgi:hypothetical protein